MRRENKAVFGIFKNESEILNARKTLKKCGFEMADVSVMFPTQTRGGVKDFAQKVDTLIKPFSIIGAIAGGLCFSFLSFFIGSGSVAIPFFSTPLNTGGQTLFFVVSLVIGLLVGAAVGALVGAGTPQTATRRYINYIHSGGILLSVHVETGDQGRRAMTALEKTGATDITFLDETDSWLTVRSGA